MTMAELYCLFLQLGSLIDTYRLSLIDAWELHLLILEYHDEELAYNVFLK